MGLFRRKQKADATSSPGAAGGKPRLCPFCKAPARSMDRFCTSCGRKLPEAA